MAKYTGSQSAAAGGLISVLDTELVKHTNWSIFDAAAGTNAKVYRCQDTVRGVLFYVYVDDNQANYAKVRVWETWNDTTHVGGGKNTAELYFLHSDSNYIVILRDNNFIYVTNGGHLDRSPYYVGELIPIISGDHHVMCCGHTVTDNYTTSPLTQPPGTGTVVKWLLWGDRGGYASVHCGPATAGITVTYGATTRYVFDTNGYAQIQEEYVANGDILYGQLDGVMMLWSTVTGGGDEDTVDVDGVEWEFYFAAASWSCIIRNT
jgi:hypothetical protein